MKTLNPIFSTTTAIVISLLLLLCFPTGKPDLNADRAGLLALRSAVRGRTLLWNISHPSPCSWTGVTCGTAGVTELRLPGMGLTGRIPPNSIGNLTNLNTISLRFNSLTGTLPPDFASISTLRNLYLQHNQLSGEIPELLYSLSNLVRLDLSNNHFTGEIPQEFNNLTRLGSLYLQYNNLTGSIPDWNRLALEQFNVSYNQLTGSVPSSLSSMPASVFAGNSLCGEPLLPCNGTSNTPTQKKKDKKLSAGAIAGIVIGSVIGFFLLLLILILCCRKRGSKNAGARETGGAKPEEVGNPVAGGGGGGSGSGSGGTGAAPPIVAAATAAGAAAAAVSKGDGNASGTKALVFFGKFGREFDLEDLLKASAEVLGKGTFGTSYKAVLEMGVVVAVKRLRDVAVPEKEFREKIEVVGTMDHENLVPLRAYYYNKDEKLLVCDYMPMGSLSALLHGNRGSSRTPLNWETRSKIALGAARGIMYLHSRGATVSHGHIKSSNILLTTSYEARVSDFGLAHLVGSTSTPNRVSGYRAPEVTDARKVSQKADVYSFGVLLLELLTGKAPTHTLLNEEGVDLPRWVQSVAQEEWSSEVFDLELLRYQTVQEEMVQLLQLAVNCAAQYPDNRPSMSTVTSQIEEICRSSSSNGSEGQ